MPPSRGPCARRAPTAAAPAKSVRAQGGPPPALPHCTAAATHSASPAAHPPRHAGQCIENAKDCGQEGRACCVTSTPSTTNYWCLAGFYCPWGDGAQDQPCKRCPPPEQAERQGVYECQQASLDSKAKGEWF